MQPNGYPHVSSEFFALLSVFIPLAFYALAHIKKVGNVSLLPASLLIAECLINSLRRGGGDLIHYVDSSYSGYSFYEPFYLFLNYARSFFPSLSPELFLSACLFLVSFVFYLPFLLLSKDSSDITKLIAVCSIFFGPSLPQAQLRLCTCASFATLASISWDRSKRLIAFSLALLSLLSYSLSPFILFLVFSSSRFDMIKDMSKLFSKLRLSKAVYFYALLFSAVVVCGFLVLSSRYSLVESIEIDKVSSIWKNLALASALIVMLLFGSSPALVSSAANPIFLRMSSNLTAQYNILLQIISLLGWMSRFRFFLYTTFTCLLVRKHNYSLVLHLFAITFTVRNLYLYLILDQQYLLFLL